MLYSLPSYSFSFTALAKAEFITYLAKALEVNSS